MGIFSILLASLLVPHHEGERSTDLEDPEKANRDMEPAADDDDGQQSPEDGITDGNESIQGSDTHDADEEEPGEQSPPGRRVTFGNTPSGEPGSPEEPTKKPRLLARLKAIVFPPHEEDEHPSNHRILPVISGLVVPFSILLEIPGLTDSWYIRTDKNAIVQTLPNPPSLEILLAISMFFAVVANVSMICRFLEKGPVLTTTLITIASLTIHGNVFFLDFAFNRALLHIDLVNIIALVVFGVQPWLDRGFTYSHAYWMTGVSAVLVLKTLFKLDDGFSVFHQCLEPH